MTMPVEELPAEVRPPRKANGAAGAARPATPRPPQPPDRFVGDDGSDEDREVMLENRGKKLRIRYNPDRISNRMRRQLLSRAGKETVDAADRDWVVEYLAQILVGWEYYRQPEDEHPWPTTVEALDELSAGFLARVLGAIQDDLNPPESGGSSGSFS